ncbi:MAG: hypothetical protein C4519_15185 [Desulfobacteraceae bacterium]|nr:MAG: hypothetical protein C4519_15185 [Desulfobacteraceae bacterium]
MTAKQLSYARLPGRKHFLFVRRSLWQGPDHLLWVEGNMMQEQYKRFYFTDIQAVILCANRRRRFWSIVWTILLLLSGACGLAFPGTAGGFWVVAALGALFLVINTLAGPCCDVYLQTAVQLEKLVTLVRVRTAARTLDRIKTMAEQVQGALQLNLVSASLRSDGPGRPQASGPAAQRRMTAAQVQAPVLLWTLAGLLLSLGLLELMQLHVRWLWLGALDMLGLAGLLGLAIMILVRRVRPVKGSLLASMGWLALILAVLRGAIAYAFLIVATLKHPEMAYNTGVMMKLFLELQMIDQPLVTFLNIGFAAAALLLGGLGVVALGMQGPAAALVVEAEAAKPEIEVTAPKTETDPVHE